MRSGAGPQFAFPERHDSHGRPLGKFVGRVSAASIELTASDLTEIEQAMPFGVAAGQRYSASQLRTVGL